VDELTTEYWRLRQLDTEEKEILERVEALQEEHDKLKRVAANPSSPITPQLEKVAKTLEDERDVLTDDLRKLQELITSAEAVRKHFNGLKLKLTVLKGEKVADAELESVRTELQTVKGEYSELASKVESLRETINLREDKIKAIEAEEQNLQAKLNHHERILTREVSDVSRRLVEDKSRVTVIDGEKNRLFVAIGQHICHASKSQNEHIRPVVRKCAPLIHRVHTLERSIEFNRRLADFR
jgi:chromosome segregation ATPase